MTATIAELAEPGERVTGDPMMPDWAYDDIEDEDDDDDLYLDEDCGKGPDGQCSYAGSEFCDWDCPLERQTWKRKKTGVTP